LPHGGDPQTIVLMGTRPPDRMSLLIISIVQSMVPHHAIKAAMLVSARRRFECLPDNPNAKNGALPMAATIRDAQPVQGDQLRLTSFSARWLHL
jgi:hypothetical protein